MELDGIGNWLERHKDILRYLFFGVLTTVVNYAVYFPLYHGLGWRAGVCNGLAWLVSVIFAFVTNKIFVFASYSRSFSAILREFAAFLGCRIGSGLLETGILLIAVDYLQGNGVLWKVLTGIVVIILNYISSKLLIFRKK